MCRLLVSDSHRARWSSLTSGLGLGDIPIEDTRSPHPAILYCAIHIMSQASQVHGHHVVQLQLLESPPVRFFELNRPTAILAAVYEFGLIIHSWDSGAERSKRSN